MKELFILDSFSLSRIPCSSEWSCTLHTWAAVDGFSELTQKKEDEQEEGQEGEEEQKMIEEKKEDEVEEEKA